MKKITLENGTVVEISEERYKALLEEVQDWKPWRAEYSQKYYCVSSYGMVSDSTETGNDSDEYRHLTGNYFETVYEAQAHKQKQMAIVRVTYAIYEFNKGWEPDWSNPFEVKCHISYSHAEGDFYVHDSGSYQDPLVIPYMKEEPNREWLDKHEEDLKLIFNVK